MKKSILTLVAVVLLSVLAYSSNKFDREMKESLKQVRAMSEKTNYNNLGDKFATIAKNNSKRFEPLYYSAYCYILHSWQLQDAKDKTSILTLAKTQIDKANKLKPNNDEIMVLEAFYYQAMIVVNPKQNGQQYSSKASMLLNKAKAINKNNPRAQFLLAQNIYYRPVQYGGGKEKALPLFKKAEKFYSKQKQENYLSPLWGQHTNGEMIKACNK